MTAVIALDKVGIVVVTITMIAELLSCGDMETSLYDTRSRFCPAALLRSFDFSRVSQLDEAP